MTLFGTYFETIPLVLMIIFAVSFIYLMLYYGLFHLRVSRYKGTKAKPAFNNNAQPSVSIVLTVKNEEKLLADNLTYFLEQNYPNYDVVVVDNVSYDNTEYVLQVFKNTYGDKLKIVRFMGDVNRYQGKKYPLSLGVQSAKNDIILFTEISCVPKGFDWVEKMVAHFANPKTQMVLGYCGINKRKGLLNSFVQYENMSQTALMFGSALLHKPCFGTLRNMALRRDFFFQKNGLIQFYNLPYGDMDLFVNKNNTKSNTDTCIEPAAFLSTDHEKTFALWHGARSRSRSSIKHYRHRDKIQLFLQTLMLILFYVAGVLLFVAKPLPVLGFSLLGVLVLKMAWQIICSMQMSRRFGTSRIVSAFSPLFEFYFLFANTFLYISTLRNKKGNGSNS